MSMDAARCIIGRACKLDIKVLHLQVEQMWLFDHQLR